MVISEFQEYKELYLNLGSSSYIPRESTNPPSLPITEVSRVIFCYPVIFI